MKKTAYIVTLLLAMIATACGSVSGSARTNRNAGSQNGATAGELPATTKLIIGTLKLEGTAQAVTAKQAADLLPLWQTMKVLSESDTAAQQEKDALVAQIQETMTGEQVQAIQEMSLSRQDMASIMQQQGTTTDSSSQRSSSQSGTSAGNGNRGFGPGAGGPPDEIRVPSGGGGFGGGQNFSREQIATAQAARQANQNVIPSALLNAVIEYLQKKAGS
jgi:hypothetical protein